MTAMNTDALIELLETLHPVEAVEGYRVDHGPDSTGDPAVWVFVVVDDARLDDVWPVWDQLRQDIREAVARVAGTETMVYVRMWSADDLDEQVRATA